MLAGKRFAKMAGKLFCIKGEAKSDKISHNKCIRIFNKFLDENPRIGAVCDWIYINYDYLMPMWLAIWIIALLL